MIVGAVIVGERLAYAERKIESSGNADGCRVSSTAVGRGRRRMHSLSCFLLADRRWSSRLPLVAPPSGLEYWNATGSDRMASGLDTTHVRIARPIKPSYRLRPT